MNISRNGSGELVDIEATDQEYDPEIMTIAGQKVEMTGNAHGRRDQKRRRRQGSFDGEAPKIPITCGSAWSTCGTGEPSRSSPAHRTSTRATSSRSRSTTRISPAASISPRDKLRGVESCGMLCSYKELGLTEHDCRTRMPTASGFSNDEGCTVGEDMNIVIGNDDSIVEFEITNNRPDCYSAHRPRPRDRRGVQRPDEAP